MKNELTTIEEAIAHAEKNGRDWSTDRAIKHADPSNKNYWELPENPNDQEKDKRQPNAQS